LDKQILQEVLSKKV